MPVVLQGERKKDGKIERRKNQKKSQKKEKGNNERLLGAFVDDVVC